MFYLKDKSKAKSPIIIQHYFKSKKKYFKYSTGISIETKYWNTKTNTITKRKGTNEIQDIKRRLNLFYFEFKDFLRIYPNPEFSELKSHLDFKVKGKKNNAKNSEFVFLMKDFADNYETKINRNTKKPVTRKQATRLKGLIKLFVEFEKKKGLKVRTETFDIKVYDKFVNYCLLDKQYAVNTVGDFIKNINKYLKEFNIDGYELHNDFFVRKFKVLSESAESVTLSEKEIQAVFEQKIENPKLLNTRNWFIIGVWTGLRISDFMKLPPINPNAKFIEVEPSKTKKKNIKVVIPIHENIKDIIRTYGMPYPIDDDIFNKQIKIVCHLVGLDEKMKGSVTLRDSNGVHRKSSGIYPKYKLISSHTCRRSFATNMYLMGLPMLLIMKITGHTTEQSFLKYIKVTPKEHAQKLLDYWNDYYEKKRL